jgi:pimeloyl-ACP methyl ester carboxylesterase
VARELAADHRVIVPDRLGYGRTGGRGAGFAANANSLAKLLRTLGEAEALVVGHSWAGGVAVEMALDFPGMVAGLGLVSSVSPVEPTDWLDRLLALPLAGTALAAATLTTAGSLLSMAPVRAFARWRLPGITKGQLFELARSWRTSATWESFSVEQRALVNELPSLAPRLASIGVPTVVLVGSVDRVVPAGLGRRLAAGIPRAELEVVPRGGHLLPQQQPLAVAAAVRRLAALPRSVTQ